MLDRREQFNRIVDGRLLTSVFQPLVDLTTGRPVGYEAIVRGPDGSDFETPEALFREAYRCGRSTDLDWACRAAAFRAAMTAGLPREFALFVNVEPAALAAVCPPDLIETMTAGVRQLNVVLELTERRLIDDPAGVLEAARAARVLGMGIAIDDVGADPASMAMMPLIRPDVIKLDLSVIQSAPNAEVARTVNGVLAEVERTGATVLAEGIETEHHRKTALAMGAMLGQGWLYGRPAPLPDRWPPVGAHTVAVQRAGWSTTKTPFEIIAGLRRPRFGSRELLHALSRHLEYRAGDPAEPAVLVTCFDDKDRLTPGLARQYASIAAASVLVAVFGVDMPAEPAAEVRGQNVAVDDPLAQEWVVVVVGPHFGGALVARRVRSPAEASSGAPDEDPDAGYAFAITYDRDLVIAAAHCLVQRMTTKPVGYRTSAVR